MQPVSEREMIVAKHLLDVLEEHAAVNGVTGERWGLAMLAYASDYLGRALLPRLPKDKDGNPDAGAALRFRRQVAAAAREGLAPLPHPAGKRRRR